MLLSSFHHFWTTFMASCTHSLVKTESALKETGLDSGTGVLLRNLLLRISNERMFLSLSCKLFKIPDMKCDRKCWWLCAWVDRPEGYVQFVDLEHPVNLGTTLLWTVRWLLNRWFLYFYYQIIIYLTVFPFQTVLRVCHLHTFSKFQFYREESIVFVYSERVGKRKRKEDVIEFTEHLIF